MQLPTVVVISDYGSGDPAFIEVMLQLRMLIPEVHLLPQSTPPFSTIYTGYWIYQISMTPNTVNTYIYSNTAPRKDIKDPRANNIGEKLMYVKLKNGFEIVAINAGYNLSFIKHEIAELHYANIANEGSQFRSRDIYPKAVQMMISRDKNLLGEAADPSMLPDFPKNVIASVDGYGNIKTTTRQSDMKAYKSGQKLVIDLNGKRHEATFTDGSFNVHDGQIAFAPGSTGHEDKFMEIFFRGASAHDLFGRPRVEKSFVIQPTED